MEGNQADTDGIQYFGFPLHPCGKVLTYAAIIQAVWGYSDYGGVKKLQVNMKNIRKKMGVTPGEKALYR